MPKSSILMALLLATVNTSVLADFYIVKDTITKSCAIVENKPADGVDGVAYKTRAEAEKALQAIKACGAAAD